MEEPVSPAVNDTKPHELLTGTFRRLGFHPALRNRHAAPSVAFYDMDRCLCRPSIPNRPRHTGAREIWTSLIEDDYKVMMNATCMFRSRRISITHGSKVRNTSAHELRIRSEGCRLGSCCERTDLHGNAKRHPDCLTDQTYSIEIHNVSDDSAHIARFA